MDRGQARWAVTSFGASLEDDLKARNRHTGFVDQWQSSAEDETGDLILQANYRLIIDEDRSLPEYRRN